MNTADSQFSEQDGVYMQQALDLAVLGECTTQPNPQVGCVIVNSGEIVGQGHHVKAGELHAERNALIDAGEKARGATAYVNLEPCCHQGRTPPCTDALIDAGVSRVVAAMRDPNPLVEGGGFELLENAGIEVQAGLLEQQARWVNRGFIQRMAEKKPWVVLKSAATLDGRTADNQGASQWITGELARQQVHHLRAQCSAVLTGIGTVLADDPQLNVRNSDAQRQPARVLLDSSLQIPLDAKIIGSQSDLIIFTISREQEKIAALNELGVDVVNVGASTDGRIDLKLVLLELAKWQFNEVMIEAGQTLSGSFIEAGLVDELVVFYGPSVLGDQAKSMFQFSQPQRFDSRPQFDIRSLQQVENDVRVDLVNRTSHQKLMNVPNANC